MSKTEYAFEGLDEFEKALTKMIEQDYPKEFEALVIQLADELKNKVKGLTPVDTSHLQDGWEIGGIVKKDDEFYIEVFNNVEYAEPVEYGHRTKKGFVKGAHMMEISLAELEKRLPDFLRDWLSDFLNNHEV